MMALFRPSMPMEMAPGRFTLVLSISRMFRSGFFSLALMAAMGPAVPPPTTTMSYSRTLVAPFSALASGLAEGELAVIFSTLRAGTRCRLAISAQAILEGIATVIEVFEIQRPALRIVRQAFYAQHRATLFRAQGSGEVFIGENGVYGKIGMAKGNTGVVFQNQKNIAGDEVCFLQLLTDGTRHPSDFQ